MVPSILSVFSLLVLAGPVALPKLVVPNFSDLTIKTHRTTDNWGSSVQTLYLKGARQRSEYVFETPVKSGSITIMQCDEKRRYHLDEKGKTYARYPIEDWAERMKRVRPTRHGEPSGAEVIITIDSVETGERRKLGSYEAQRVKTTTKVEPGPGAVTQASLTEVDGWYFDVPGIGCQESQNVGATVSAFWSGGEPRKQDRIVLKRLGRSARGYAIEETSRHTQGNRTTVSKVELVEFSEAPLHVSLFDLPAGYKPALRKPYGNYDMSKPDTLANRLQAYWTGWTASVRRWFR